MWFYRCNVDGKQPVYEKPKEYLGTVESIAMNNKFAAVLADQRVQLHTIEPPDNGRGWGILHIDSIFSDVTSKLFPEKEEDFEICCIALTSDLLIFATTKGNIFYFHLQEWAIVNE